VTLPEFIKLAQASPLVASVQASPGSPVEDPGTLARLAQASLDQGVKFLRLQGEANIREIRQKTGAPTIGLIKQTYPESDVYITPTPSELQALIDLGCEIIAFDATPRKRPGGATVPDLIARIHAAGRLAMADCDGPETVAYALKSGADLIGTTLAGYTPGRPPTTGPDFELLRTAVALAKTYGKPIIAEGRFAARWEVEAALRIGATAVVVGGAINDPVKTTRMLSPRSNSLEAVGVIDIGGTWLRFATCDSAWNLSAVARIPLPQSRQERTDWIKAQIQAAGVTRIAVSTGGTVDPASGIVWEAKPIIPEHLGSTFATSTFEVPTIALNDGLATAWGHACLPQYAGMRIATLALGTGVGAGFVDRGRIWCGPRGEYPRLNDIQASEGRTIEALLGGASLTPNPTEDAKEEAKIAFRTAVRVTREMVYPDMIIIAGTVGLSEWLNEEIQNLGCRVSPFGTDAGLKGAAALALFPPEF